MELGVNYFIKKNKEPINLFLLNFRFSFGRICKFGILSFEVNWEHGQNRGQKDKNDGFVGNSIGGRGQCVERLTSLHCQH